MKEYYSYTAQELMEKAKLPVYCMASSEEVFRALADEMISLIEKHNAQGRRTVIICPVGPVGHYPYFVQQVNEKRISLKNCWFFNMDEYLEDESTWVAKEHMLSFRGFMDRELFAGILEGKRGDFWLSWYTSELDAQRHLQQDAAQIIFDRYNPMPVAPAMNRISELEIFFIPEIDAAGKATGKIIDGDITVFCRTLETERPDRTALRRAVIGKWRQFGRMLAVNERELCQQAADTLLESGENSDVPQRFNTVVAKLKQALLKRQKNSAFLTRVLDRATPPMLRMRTVLRAADEDETALSDREREFFNRTLDLYLR